MTAKLISSLIALELTSLAALGQDPALTFHAAPRPLPEGAVTEDWPRFLGAHDNGTSKETRLLKKWPEGGPRKVWELLTGEGYSSPVFAEGKLVYFHRLDDPEGTHRDAGRETIDCLEPESGKRLWRVDYPIRYRDRYGFSPGPRSSPVLYKGKVYVVGVTAIFHCLDLETGKVIWKRDLKKEYNIPTYFFGYGPSPALWNDRIIVNVGGKAAREGEGVCVAALDAATGKTLWEVKDAWGASYASPVITRLRGKDCAIVAAAGESRPPHGGLLTIDPATGRVYDRFPWRADIYESVLASTPLVMSEKRVYLGDCYAKGGVVLEFDENLESKVLWKARWFGMHWATPLLLDGHLYGFAGRNIPDTQFKCANAETGEILWENEMRWREGRRITGLFRATLLHADNRIFCLGEDGVLAELRLTPKGPEFVQRVRLFAARSSWALPSLHRGLLYVSQNEHDLLTNAPPRLVCYDFRGN
ncbi:MAG: PQQ-binding-like beta-propeller repeat protein [Akkermansiaceae bacterium]|nr:PQQ-binding-like beta-propeller repeat protein [Akkermansiaceae bacterium]